MDIEGYPNYLIYEDGRVYSKKRRIFLKPSENRHGYLYVDLCKNGKKKTHIIHRLIAFHYIPNPENLPCCDHKNHNRQDNSIRNLRWVTQRENMNNLKNQSEFGCNIHRHGNSFRFRFIIDGERHSKTFKTLEETIKYKEEFIRNFEN